MSNFPDAHKVYELAAVFRERVIEQGRSFLWPDQEIWSAENIEKLLSFETRLFDEGDRSIPEVAEAFSDEPTEILMMAADVQAACHFFWSTTKPTTRRLVGLFTNLPNLPPVDENTWSLLEEQAPLEVPASWMTHKQTGLSWHLSAAFTISTFRLNRHTSRDTTTIETELLGMNRPGIWYHHVWCLAHVLYPEQIPSLPAEDPRRKVINRYRDEAQVDASLGEFGQLQQIRKYLEPRMNGDHFDFHHPSVYLEWENRERFLRRWLAYDRGGPIPDEVRLRAEDILDPEIEIEDSEALPPAGVTSGAQPEITASPNITDLAEQTFLQESFLRDIESLLESKKQLIFEGPPGSGKTYVAEKFARYFTDQPLTGERNDRVELVQFHQSYSYEDFVEGIRPRMDGGQLVYHVEAGIFLRLVGRAAENPHKRYVLIIDEINRGNVSRILGELMLLLEYRDKSATLPYSKDPLQIPPNLYIIGTMNTADRSLSQIDYALRRRFYFVRFMSVENGAAPVLDGWLARKNLDATTHASILQMFIALNQQLETDLGTDDLQVGHSYFMDDNIHNERQQQHIWTYAVLPLIREYLYHHRERESLLDHYRWDRLTRMVTPTVEELIPTESLETDAFNEFEQ